MSDQQLRFTETNSADDSQGRTWGLDGSLFWYVVGGVLLSVIILLLLFSAMHMSLAAAAIAAAIPLTLTFGYVFGFRQGRPPGYDIDITDYWLNGAGFALNPQRQPELALDRSQSGLA